MPFLRVPRLGETPGSGKGNPSTLVAHARLGALAGGLLAAFLAAPLLAELAEETTLAAGTFLTAGLAATLTAAALLRTRLRFDPTVPAAALGVLAVWLLSAWLGRVEPSVRVGTPFSLLLDATDRFVVAAVVVAVATPVAILATGLVVDAARKELDAGGLTPVSAVAPLRPASILSVASVLGLGFAAPGLLAAEWSREAVGQLRAKVARKSRVVVHVDIDAVDLAEATVGLRKEGLTLAHGRVLLPQVENGALVFASGPPPAVAKFVSILETDLLLSGSFAWSREARRAELRLRSLALEAESASTLEERGALLEEASAVSRLLSARAFVEEERALLVGWKAPALVVRLHEAVAAGASGRGPHRSTAPGPYLEPDLGFLLEAGGLDALRDVVYVPWRILPVATPSGEEDVAVDAVIPRYDAGEERGVLRALSRRGPRLLVEGALPRFVPPGPVEATVAALEPVFGQGAIRKELADVVYVPFLSRDSGSVNLVTGREGGPLPLLPTASIPEGTLVS